MNFESSLGSRSSYLIADMREEAVGGEELSGASGALNPDRWNWFYRLHSTLQLGVIGQRTGLRTWVSGFESLSWTQLIIGSNGQSSYRGCGSKPQNGTSNTRLPEQGTSECNRPGDDGWPPSPGGTTRTSHIRLRELRLTEFRRHSRFLEC